MVVLLPGLLYPYLQNDLYFNVTLMLHNIQGITRKGNPVLLFFKAPTF